MSTIPTARPGGLIGLAGHLSRRIGSLANSAEALALYLVFGAGVITILKKAGVQIPDYAMYFGVSLGIAALLYEMHSAKAMARAWFNAKPGALAAATAIWVCAFGYSVNNWMGAASESQAEKSNTHKAAFLNSQDVRKELADADAKVARLSEERNLMKPKTSVAAARATIATSTAHKFWRSTDACKTTKGPQTRAFCDAYASAIADVALWDQIAKQEIALADAEADAKDARSKASGTRVEVSEARNDLVILTKYAGMTEEEAQIFNGLGAIIAISIFLSFGSMRAELERLSQTGTRRRFNAGLSLYRWYYRIVHGKEPPSVTIQHNTYGTVDGLRAADLEHVLRKNGVIAA
jgi:hypothetical protein